MAFELMTEVPSLLREGYVMYFDDKWAKEWAKKYFRVEIAQQMEYHTSRIVAPGTSAPANQDISFDKPAGGGVSNTYMSLLPESSETVYEILMGIKGLVLVYPRYNDRYFLQLEVTGVQPDLTNSLLRFLGCYTHEHSPYYAPKLREHTVTDQTPTVLRLFNPFVNDETIDLRFIVNRCKVVEVAEADLTDQERRAARKIRHFNSYIW